MLVQVSIGHSIFLILKNQTIMKTQKFILSFCCILFCSAWTFAQESNPANADKKETIKVWGNCGMCKKTIETAAKKAGATTADWSTETRMLAVAYNPAKSSNQKIQKAVAAAGYDTKDFTASDETYNKLHFCCQYDRKSSDTSTAAVNAACCDTEKCGKDSSCCKDAKCCEGKDVCKDTAACKEKGCCKS
jgi:periplasmic mercuric ion binding protein